MAAEPNELALPASMLRHLREALREETDPLSAIHALHTAGFGCADDVHELFVGDSDASRIDQATFWSGLSDFFRRRGWGRLRHEAAHPALGVLSSSDWAEARGGAEPQPSCAFTSGLLSGLLTRAAGGGVAVLETSCRARGDDECRFCFGSEDAIHELYGLLLEGLAFDAALERL